MLLGMTGKKHWRVCYVLYYEREDGSQYCLEKFSEFMDKATAKGYMNIFEDAIYIIKERGWFNKGKRIYK